MTITTAEGTKTITESDLLSLLRMKRLLKATRVACEIVIFAALMLAFALWPTWLGWLTDRP